MKLLYFFFFSWALSGYFALNLDQEKVLVRICYSVLSGFGILGNERLYLLSKSQSNQLSGMNGLILSRN